MFSAGINDEEFLTMLHQYCPGKVGVLAVSLIGMTFFLDWEWNWNQINRTLKVLEKVNTVKKGYFLAKIFLIKHS